jgi:short-subunit dehydrogenase
MYKPTKLTNKVIILTGASSGIGEALAVDLAREKPILVLVARREQRLKRLAAKLRGEAADVIVAKTDITKYAQVKRTVARVRRKVGRIDALINIAGWGSYGWFEKFRVYDIRKQFDVNVLGASYLIHEVIPVMQAQRSGHIVNMISYASRVAVPPMTVYASTKYALEGLTDGLRRELSPWGIRVSRIHPGGVRGTEYNAWASARGNVTFKSPGIGNVTRQQAARRIHKLLLHPRREVMLGWVYDLPAFFNRYFPSLVDLVMNIYVAYKRRRELRVRTVR